MIQTMIRLWLLLALLGWMIDDAFAQVVNIERQRISSDSTGWLGQARVNFIGAKNTVSLLSFSAGTLLEYKSKSNKDLWLLITDIGLTKGDGAEFVNTGFGHLRYNRKLSGGVRWEFFSQIQYNSLLHINRRALFGTGPRFKLSPYDNAKFYWGVAVMHEYEESTEPRVIRRDARLSSYFSMTLLPQESISLSSTIYVQPLLQDFMDYRIANETALTLAITKKLNLVATFHYNFDAFPPAGAPRDSYFFSNSLEIGF
jgi:hypothetical protein